MIYITGDMHGDISAFKRSGMGKIRKGDCLIVCGDFGFLWEDTEKEKKILKTIGQYKYNVLFVEGCHENYSMLNQYEIDEWNGGRVRVISGNLRQLMRGEIYEIESKKFFVFGGGDSRDKDIRIESSTHWSEEVPSIREVSMAFERLQNHGNKIDYIITHEAPLKVKSFINLNDMQESYIHVFLDKVSDVCSFKAWYFGKYHVDRLIPPCYNAVFKGVKKITDTEAIK